MSLSYEPQLQFSIWQKASQAINKGGNAFAAGRNFRLAKIKNIKILAIKSANVANGVKVLTKQQS